MSKKLTAYFSASGVTAKAAQTLARATGSELYEIRPAVEYTREDLDWTNKHSRSTLEMSDHACRPGLADTSANIGEYDTIYLCFPIWWYREPSIIDTFLDSYDFSGKKIVLFATSGGSKFGKTALGIRKLVPTAEVVEGRMLNGRIMEADLQSWT